MEKLLKKYVKCELIAILLKLSEIKRPMTALSQY